MASANAKREAPPENDLPIRGTCEWCGEDILAFDPEIHVGDRIYCSAKCAGKTSDPLDVEHG